MIMSKKEQVVDMSLKCAVNYIICLLLVV
jgi:hypothetical protein